VGEGLWWKHLWKMQIPPKVRILWGRVIYDLLQVMAILKFRHISRESYCQDSGDPSETVFHTLFECSYARMFWECIMEITSVKPLRMYSVTWAKDLVGNLCST
jgi:hypothetical protein